MQKFVFSKVRDFINVQASNFTKIDVFSLYFTKIMTRSTEELFRRTLFDD